MIIKTNQDEIQNYLVDASNFKGQCEAVYIPENINELIKIIKYLYQSNTKFTISGAGTGLTGGRVPLYGVVISTEKLNKIIEINLEQKYVIVEPGVLLSDLIDKLNSIKCFYPPDPTEKNCSVGGTIANNASGAKSFKYGPTRNFIIELDIILPDGDQLLLKRNSHFAKNLNLTLQTISGNIFSFEIPQINLPLTKNAAGYFLKQNMDVIDLFIGSEGTLGVISKAKLKILPFPEKIISAISFFYTELDALKFIDNIRNQTLQNRKNNLTNQIDALALEFFDANSLKLLSEKFSFIPKIANAAVWFEQDANQLNYDNIINLYLTTLIKHNCSEDQVILATNNNERNQLEEFRHSISAVVNDYIAKLNLQKLGTDIAIPDDEMFNFYFYLLDIIKNYKIDYVLYGHLGNSHFHLNILPKTENEFLLGKKLYTEISNKAIQLKGTISAEHGIGKIKRELLLKMLEEQLIDAMKSIKLKLDPKNLLNYGNIFINMEEL